jgi:hypothetical protein
VTGELRKISLAGGSSVRVADKVDAAQWSFGIWTDDNNIIFGSPSTNSGLRRVSAEGGEVTGLTSGRLRCALIPVWRLNYAY